MKHKKFRSKGVKTVSSRKSAGNITGNNSKNENSSNIGSITRPFKQPEVRTFLLSDDTDLNVLGKELIAESNKDNPKMVNLIIDNARTYKLEEIDKLRSIILNIPIFIFVQAINNIDFTELVVLTSLNTGYINITEGCNIIMDSVEPFSEADLERVSKRIAVTSSKCADEISDYYKKKAVIHPDTILREAKLDPSELNEFYMTD